LSGREKNFSAIPLHASYNAVSANHASALLITAVIYDPYPTFPAIDHQIPVRLRKVHAPICPNRVSGLFFI